jgi:hypothetical protein
MSVKQKRQMWQMWNYQEQPTPRDSPSAPPKLAVLEGRCYQSPLSIAHLQDFFFIPKHQNKPRNSHCSP